jgi:ribokinase
MSKILVVGSLHYDIIIDAHHRPEKGETVIGTGCAYKFGGKGGNQAVSIAKAGADAIFFGAVGSDEQGHFLIKKLNDSHIETSFIQVLKGIESGMSVATMDVEGDYGAVVCSNANLHIDVDQLGDAELWSDVSMLLLQNEVLETTNLRAASEAKARNIPVWINAAPAKVLSKELQALIDVLVVNGVEARDMSGLSVDDLNDARLAAVKLNETFETVIVTAGEHGVAYSTVGGIQGSIPAEKIKLISTHGAGDCFMGMLCASVNQGVDLEQAIKRANHAAAVHVSQPQV